MPTASHRIRRGRGAPAPLAVLAAPLAVLAALLLIAGSAVPLWALSEQEVDARVLQITDMLRCPTCQGISVRDSEAAFSRQIRDKVRRMVEEGQSEDDIKAYFVSRYGEWILRAPMKEGFGLVLWIAPIAAIVLAGGLIGYRIMRGRDRAVADGPTRLGLTDEQRERIAQDLQRFEEED